jgi:hypothetical protein
MCETKEWDPEKCLCWFRLFPIVKTKSNDCSRPDCNHLKIIQKIPEPQTRKAQEIKKFGVRGFIQHCTHTLESTKVEVQNIERGN